MGKKSEYYKACRPEMMSYVEGAPKRILEIGCGEGNFRRSFPRQIEYWGVELIPEVAERAKGLLDKVLVGSIDAVMAELPTNYFDLIVCNDVIEHLPDTNKFLSGIKSKMAQHGALVASVPNVRCISNLVGLMLFKDWRYVDQGILDDTYLRFFTKKSFERTCVENGYYVEKIGLVNKVTNLSLFRPLSWFAAMAAILMGRDIRYQQIAVRLSDKDQRNRTLDI